MSFPSKTRFGSEIEARACAWFLGQDPSRSELCRNYRWRGGELDLVFEEKAPSGASELVFVEVRARLSGSWTEGLESISFPKQLRLRRTIDRFLARYRGRARGARFDVIAWDGRRFHHHPNVWLPELT